MPLNKPTYVVIVESLERFQFYTRVCATLNHFIDIQFITTEPLVYLTCRVKGYSVKLVTNAGVKAKYVHGVDQSIEVLNSEFELKNAIKSAGRLVEILSVIHSKKNISKIVCWNGQQVLGVAVRQFAKEYSVSTQFLELSNLPDKCFSDPIGVNANSNLASRPEILDGLPEVPEDLHQIWLSKYKEFKNRNLPQAKLSNKSMKLINFVLKGLYPAACKHQLKRISNITCLQAGSDYPLDRTVEFKHFIFLPMQVSGDTQIKLNSDVDNLQAIGKAWRLAKDKGVQLIVKVHPAEVSQMEVDEVLGLRPGLDFYISGENTVDLIERSMHVVTINSTVGLEAMILNKPVTVLGRALYSQFTSIRLKKYIHHYLVSGVDYFSNEKISTSSAKKLLGVEGNS